MELLTPFMFDMTIYDFIQKSIYFDATEFVVECGKLELPEQWIKDLSKITYGQRIDLSELNENNFLTLPLHILSGVEPDQIATMKASEVILFSSMVAEGLKELNERDQKYLVYEFDEEEIKAGIKKLNHGLFGSIDNLAKRCPQYTHDEILNLSQSVVFQMLKIDIDNANYAKRLRKVMQDKK